jgi:hypothetical protein
VRWCGTGQVQPVPNALRSPGSSWAASAAPAHARARVPAHARARVPAHARARVPAHARARVPAHARARVLARVCVLVLVLARVRVLALVLARVRVLALVCVLVRVRACVLARVRVLARVCVLAFTVAGVLQVQAGELVQDSPVDVAGHDRGQRRVTGGGVGVGPIRYTDPGRPAAAARAVLQPCSSPAAAGWPRSSARSTCTVSCSGCPSRPGSIPDAISRWQHW